jgi:hypothetical protein
MVTSFSLSLSLSFFLIGLVGSLVIPIFHRLSILAIVFSVMKIGTPCTINSHNFWIEMCDGLKKLLHQ